MNPMYGGMTPALMAQWYQRMQAYYATMGRGMMPAMGMNQPMMGGMPNMNMQGMPMGGMPQQMMGMPQQPQPGQQMGYQPMNQGFVGSSPPQQPHHFQQEPSSHEGEYTYDTGSDQGPSQHSPPPMDGVPSGPRGSSTQCSNWTEWVETRLRRGRRCSWSWWDDEGCRSWVREWFIPGWNGERWKCAV